MSEDFLSRWSRLKRSGTAANPAAPPAAPPAARAVPGRAAAASPTPASPPPPLPPVESLEPGADIAQFMRAEVEEVLRRQALKKLFQDPRFNVMDGLDVYIDDYSKPDPLPEGWLEKMNQSIFAGHRDAEPETEPQADAAPEPGDVATGIEANPPAHTLEGSPDTEGTQSARDP